MKTSKAFEKVLRNEMLKFTREKQKEYDEAGMKVGLEDFTEYINSLSEKIYDEILEQDRKEVLPKGTPIHIPSLSWQVDEKKIAGDYTVLEYAKGDASRENYYKLISNEKFFTREGFKNRVILVDESIIAAIQQNRMLESFVYVGLYGGYDHLCY